MRRVSEWKVHGERIEASERWTKGRQVACSMRNMKSRCTRRVSEGAIKYLTNLGIHNISDAVEEGLALGAVDMVFSIFSSQISVTSATSSNAA